MPSAIAFAAMLGFVISNDAIAEDPTPGFNTKIPESIMIPDTVGTRVGTLKFFDGMPTKETAALLLENLDLNRGVETFLNGMPAALRLYHVLKGGGCHTRRFSLGHCFLLI